MSRPLRGELGGAGEHREGVLLADAVEARDGLQHGVAPLAPARPAARFIGAQFNRLDGENQMQRDRRSIFAAIVAAEVAQDL